MFSRTKMWTSLLLLFTLHGIFVLGHVDTTTAQAGDKDLRTCKASTDTECMETENTFPTIEVEEEVDYEANISGSFATWKSRDRQNEDPFSDVVPVTETETRLVLVGRTGEGKSTTANSIIGRQHFTARVTAKSVTEHCAYVKEKVQGRELLLVDTPGLFDTAKPNNETLLEIMKSLMLSAPGPHAFLLVLSTQRFTKEIETTVELVRKAFGEDILNYTVIVFTKREDLDRTNTSISNYLKEIPDYMEKLLDACSWRYVAFNNWLEGEENAQQVAELLKVVDDLLKSNAGKFYSSEQYKNVEENIKLAEKRMKEEIEKQRQENIAPYLKILKEAEKEKERLQKENEAREEKIRKLKAEQEEDKKKLRDQKLRQEKADAREKERRKLEEEERQERKRMEAQRRAEEEALRKMEEENRQSQEKAAAVRENIREETVKIRNYAREGALIGATAGAFLGPKGAAIGFGVGLVAGSVFSYFASLFG